MFKTQLEILKQTPITLVLTYVIIYFIWGIGMDNFGAAIQVARFSHWWQVISCYILYMVPISIVLKKYSFFTQYAYGLVAMGFLEFFGYWFQTSYAYPGNILDKLFQPQNFSLSMALFFALYFPLGNRLVAFVHKKVFKNKEEKQLKSVLSFKRK